MATGQAVWGIDLGQCALKALRCRLDEDGETLIADAFDYIEYPKILTQPDAEPETLIAEALSQFLSRNSLRGDQVAISVSGQSGLARFIKLPPVDSSKIPDIVKYEAKQQIPFPLEEVIWDYQQLAGGTEEDGFALETEVGLFAMKRDQVFKSIRPYDDAGIELDVIQLAPLAIYNMVAYDLLNDQDGQPYNQDDPPESMIVLSMGTDTSDLVITNGYRVWQRSIPIGGNHFTRQLTKDLKLTFAKAEHLKRNARQAEDPRTVFQAMRSVFNDLVNEVQRSLSFFRSIDRNAKIGKLLVLGNAVKLPGLLQYLGKNLDMEVIETDDFRRLGGVSVTGAPTFKENSLAFAVCYGLCVQGLGKGRLSTSLLPRDIVINRMIKEKKPWAAAAVGGLLLALAFHFFFVWNKWHTADKNRTDPSGNTNWDAQIKAAAAVKADADRMAEEDKKKQDEFARLKSLASAIIGTGENRLLWLELMRAVNLGLPVDADPNAAPGTPIDPGKISKKPIPQRKELHIGGMESEYFDDLKLWFTEPVKKKFLEQSQGVKSEVAIGPSVANPPMGPMPVPMPPAAAPPAAPPAAAPPPAAGPPPAAADPNAPPADAGPEGPGWVVEISGYHLYQNDRPQVGGENFLRETILRHLLEGKIELPIPGAPEGSPKTAIWSMKELGVKYAVILDAPPIDRNFAVPNPASQQGGVGVGPGPGGIGPAPMGPLAGPQAPGKEEPAQLFIPRQTFRIQFAWKETPLSKRIETRIAEQKKADAAAAANAPPGGPPPAPPSTSAPAVGGK